MARLEPLSRGENEDLRESVRSATAPTVLSRTFRRARSLKREMTQQPKVPAKGKVKRRSKKSI
eukprot:365871-Chlamydomonas_euryale.AAC.4